MMNSGAVCRLAMVACLLLAILSGCQNGSEDGGDADQPVTFASDTLAVSYVEPGDMLEIAIKGSSSEISKGFFVRFTLNTDSVDSPVSHAEVGKAFVMVPPMPAAAGSGLRISIVDMQGNVTDVHPVSLGIGAVASYEAYTRGSFDAAVGGGLARLVSLAVEALDTLDTEGVIDTTTAGGIRVALNQQIDILSQIAVFNANLETEQMGLLQQMLENSGFLQFLADAAGVPLTSTGSQSGALHSIWRSLIESALLKADFASLLIGEVRGALNLLAYVMLQVSGWPIIGSWAQGVANWATGLSSTLQTPQHLINSLIPCDMVTMTGPSAFSTSVGQPVNVQVQGRFETEEAFDSQLMTQLISQYVTAAVGWIATKFQSYLPSAFTGYLQQLGASVPAWVMGWLTSSGYIQTTVMPGQSYTVLVLDNFALDMAQYRFDVAGIVANLLNLPYSAINAFFNWIGVGVGQPVGGYAGVSVVNGNVASYAPSADTINGLANGRTAATFTAPMGRPANGWWAQWGFYSLNKTQRTVALTVQ